MTRATMLMNSTVAILFIAYPM